MQTKQAHTKVQSILKRYWAAYGGVRALVRSMYLWSSLVLSVCFYQLWLAPGWWDTVLSVIPNLLGFSLGGFALWIAIGDDSFREVIAVKRADKLVSIYDGINANFVHFIVLQVLALLCALWAKGMNFSLPADSWVLVHYRQEYFTLVKVFNYLGFAVFVYALLTALSATLGLYRVTKMYEMYLASRVKREANKQLRSNRLDRLERLRSAKYSAKQK